MVRVNYSTKQHNRAIITATLVPAKGSPTIAYSGFPGSNEKVVAQMLFVSQLTLPYHTVPKCPPTQNWEEPFITWIERLSDVDLQ